ncbi:MAG: hypothetical protein IPN53_02785 [Comamonadaceae bacterium]|nr:hypothetical protein [Comamonadaceae bacterium]
MVTQGGLQSRFAGFAVPLMGTGCQTQGVVMCNQPCTIDITARSGRFDRGRLWKLIAEVLARLVPILSNQTDSGRRGAQRSGIKEEPEGRGTAAELSAASS